MISLASIINQLIYILLSFMSVGRESRELASIVSQHQVVSQNTNAAHSSVEADSDNTSNPQVIDASDTVASMKSIFRLP